MFISVLTLDLLNVFAYPHSLFQFVQKLFDLLFKNVLLLMKFFPLMLMDFFLFLFLMSLSICEFNFSVGFGRFCKWVCCFLDVLYFNVYHGYWV